MSNSSTAPLHVDSQDEQVDVVAFLSDPNAYPAQDGSGPGHVERIQTHAAIVFLAGSHAYKIKRAVTYAYLDFSALEKRRRICLHELAVNRINAPDIYLGVVPITRDSTGQLAIDGHGEVLEWALHMRRFPSTNILSARFERTPPSADLIGRLATRILAQHDQAARLITLAGAARIGGIVDELRTVFAATPSTLPQHIIDTLIGRMQHELHAIRFCLKLRGRQGCVRRCHGDLHLGNIVLIDDKPVLFDALEFDETLATIDVLYDLAFLIMDLDVRGFAPAANLLLNRYLQIGQRDLDIHGLRALPLFLALRAGIRAMVAVERGQGLTGTAHEKADAEARRYVEKAMGYLAPRHSQLVAIGGYSGTGKSTLASSLASEIGAFPGAIHLRSDIERKAMSGARETERLASNAYTPETNSKVYDRLLRRARQVLRSGCSVVVDAAFLLPAERTNIEAVARRSGVPFSGVWLTAGKAIATHRVSLRQGDASDATTPVVEAQFANGTGHVSWTHIEADGTAEDTLANARSALG